VDALHDAGIEVLVDVVLNHTSEGDERGPALCFRAIDNAIYYYIDGDGRYRDMTGCGNTVNCNHPVVLEFMHQCLRHWVLELGVDGFRFDLACVINRDRFGNLQRTSPLVDLLSEDPVLRNVKLIAEPWDLGGGYQVGGFGWHRWSEWNDRFRDDVRRFWKGDPGMKGAFASRLTGSPDLYQHDGRLPQSSINFITAHDGFTLRDLVSYQRKHNKANGENNRDGSDHGNSWNCGVEGETDDAIVQALRARQQKNLLASLLLSLGTPMLLGGDEFGRTQHGNNNAYCQDNELSWFDWTLLEKNAELHRFCRALIRFRRENPVLTQTRFFTGKPAVKGGSPDLAWYDPAGKALDWAARDGCLACRMDGAHNHGRALYFMFNPTSDACEFRPAAGAWRMRFYTGKGAPFDAPDEDDAPRLEKGDSVVLGQRTMMVLDGADD
jgi:glycogen operon protein